jgi:hypothetical protein
LDLLFEQKSLREHSKSQKTPMRTGICESLSRVLWVK